MSALVPVQNIQSQPSYYFPPSQETNLPPYNPHYMPPETYVPPPPEPVEEDFDKSFEPIDWNLYSDLAKPFVELETCKVAGSCPNVPRRCPVLPQYTPYFQPKYPRLADDEPTLLERNIAAIVKICDEYRNSLFQYMMYYAVDGFDSHKIFPFYVAVWKPNPIKSTKSRRDRYLKMFHGNQDAATQHIIDKSNPIKKRVMVSGVGFIPYLGDVSGYLLNVWHQLRQITLIAAVHGHDIHNDEVQEKIFNCLLGGNLFKAIGLSTDKVIYKVAEDWFKKLGVKETVSQIIPLNVVFNFLSNDAAKVSGHAKLVFAGEKSIPVNDWNS